jgi:hypothetical protein
MKNGLLKSVEINGFGILIALVMMISLPQMVIAQDKHTLIVSSGMAVNFSIAPPPTGLGSRSADSKTIGIAYRYDFGNNFYLHSGVSFSKYDITTESHYPLILPEDRVHNSNTSIINIPLLAGKKVFNHFFLETGPTLTYHIKPDAYYYPENQSGLGWTAAFGADIKLNDFHVLIKPTYTMNNITLVDSYDRLNDLGLNIGIGYSF